jgi:hypothetical protein
LKFARLGFGLIFTLSLVTGVSQVAFSQANPTPPPPPRPNPGATAGATTGTPTPATTPLAPMPSTQPTLQPKPTGKGGKKAKPSPEPSPSDTPEPPQFASLDGVWEVQLQPLDGSRTVYQHLTVKQDGGNISGTWDRPGQAKVPYTGTFDGRLFKLVVATKPKDTIFTGYAENFGDMVGLIDAGGKAATPFTASHRKREKIGQ